ncbi:hypothetical protein DUNSADRAFT_16327 [Dunaliella salina]|uniref:Uncharacterized protein n=1 Tax=Dunaliella salina TaxID=3046 RepID=A0ABQ7G3S0_DUNSA|nr:hypothetical protein DUNSADRAFT_16327 [Dunaliella salina]|eukprot:KAF5829254.1 hypothetical protein DUNSADRAFT_16327 [Dunaliella salina]
MLDELAEVPTFFHICHEPEPPPPLTCPPEPLPGSDPAALPPASTAPSSSGRSPYATPHLVGQLRSGPRSASLGPAHPQPQQPKGPHSQPPPPTHHHRFHTGHKEPGPSARDTQQPRGTKASKDPKGANRHVEGRSSSERRRSSPPKHQPERHPQPITGGKRHRSPSSRRKEHPKRRRSPPASCNRSPSAASRGTSSHTKRQQEPLQEQLPLPPPLNTLLDRPVEREDQPLDYDDLTQILTSQSPAAPVQQPTHCTPAAPPAQQPAQHTPAAAPAQHTAQHTPAESLVSLHAAAQVPPSSPLYIPPLVNGSEAASPPSAPTHPLTSLPATLPASLPAQTGPFAEAAQHQHTAGPAPQTAAHQPPHPGTAALPTSAPQQPADPGPPSFPYSQQPFAFTPSTLLPHPTPSSVPDLYSHQIIVRITPLRPIHSSELSQVLHDITNHNLNYAAQRLNSPATVHSQLSFNIQRRS